MVFAMSAFKGEADTVAVEVRENSLAAWVSAVSEISLNFSTRDCQKTRLVSS